MYMSKKCVSSSVLVPYSSSSSARQETVKEEEEKGKGREGAEEMALADDEKVKVQAQQIIGLYQNLPRLIVFDLDYTLWPFYCEFYDDDDKPYLYPHARGILNTLKDRGIEVAIASRSPTSKTAIMLLDKLGLRSIFVAEEIFSSWTHKTEHFQKIQHKTGIPYESMLFFDDEDRNTIAVSKMGVTCILVENGVTLEALRQGLSNFSRNSC